MTLAAALDRRRWLWSFVAAAAVWLVAAASNHGAGLGGSLTAALTFASFYVLVGLGQMFVVALGPGNVDLSIPATITVAGVVAMKGMAGADGAILWGVLLAAASGMAVGIVNTALIELLRIPPIIATLACGFLVRSAAISYGRGLVVKPPPLLAWFTQANVFAVPLLALLVLLVSGALAVVLLRTLYGRYVLAVGQNRRAAWLTGVPVRATSAACYVLCGALAGLCGLLLASFSGGASLDMGDEYLLGSIATVVVGGTAVSGGRANVPGLWGAALFLFLLVSMLNTFGLSAGVRLILTGLVIVGVIAIGGRDSAPH